MRNFNFERTFNIMEFKFNRTGAERKAFVQAISKIVGKDAVYMQAPSFAYKIENYTVDREGTLTYSEQLNIESVKQLLEKLHEQGFVTVDFMPANSTEETISPEMSDDAFIQDTLQENQHESEIDSNSSRFTISVTLDGFTENAINNLEKLVANKSSLIMKSLDVADLPIERKDEQICFPWFDPAISDTQKIAYTQFIKALCIMAKKQKRVTNRITDVDSEKYAFRCFLLRLGFIGYEYTTTRKILLENLTGSGAFKKNQ